WFLCAACALLRLVLGIFLLLSHRPRNSPLFPYTPLFRSLPDRHRADPGHGAPPAPPDGPRDVGIAGASARDPDRAAQASYFFTRDRKSTRLNSSHVKSSYAVFCLKKKTTHGTPRRDNA